MSSKQVMHYQHDDWVAGHGDVLKLVVWTALLKQLQVEHPQGLTVTDGTAGDGVYDLNQHGNPTAYQNGIVKVLRRFESETDTTTPKAVQDYCHLVLKTTGCCDANDLDVFPGSPVLTQRLLRAATKDEHCLLDPYVELVQWMDVPGSVSKFHPLDCYDTHQSLPLLLPYANDDGTNPATKHPVILLDPDYWNDDEYGQVQQLLKAILEQHPRATILLWLPLIQNSPMRWSFATSVKEIAKKYCATGRYFCSLQISPTKYQGSAVLVCNPPATLDEIVDDACLHWLANTMHQGKDEFTIEQVMKKKKK